ncbi:thioredoxin-disulfide reductase [soil metagenome]
MEHIIVYGARWCPDCTSVKQYLQAQHLPFTWLNIEESETLTREAVAKAGGSESIPVIILPSGKTLVCPSLSELAEALGKPVAPSGDILTTDVAIIGAGPAGITAAIYCAREQLKALVFDKQGVGGQAIVTASIENYPGFEEPIAGVELMEHMANQAMKFGAEIHAGVEVLNIHQETPGYVGLTTSNGEVRAKSVILALGTRYRFLNVPGETEYSGKGVHYCATCDGPFYRGKEVIVVGGGNSALQEALFLTQFASHIHLISFDPIFSASHALQEKVKGVGEKITPHFNQQTQEITATGEQVTGITMKDRSTGSSTILTGDGVFIFVGLDPQTTWLPSSITRNKAGFVESDKILQTSLPGVFAAGDCRAGATMQVAAAVGEGATVALMVRHYLEGKV